MIKHTPGPWRVLPRHTEESAEILQLAVDDSHGMCVAWIVNRQPAITFGSDVANARLIAAAPDLLRLLRAITEACANADNFADLCIEAEALIAKVDGCK